MPVLKYFNSAGVSFDLLFEPASGGNGVSDPNYLDANGDPVIYADVATGAQGPDVKYDRTDGLGNGDLASLWAQIGTGGGGGIGLIPTPNYDGQFFEHNAYTQNAPTSARLTFSAGSDGTWQVTGLAGNVEGSGNWFDPTTPGLNADYEIRISDTGNLGSTDIVNPAVGWVQIGTGIDYQATITTTTHAIKFDDFDVTVEIRPTGGATASTGTFHFSLYVENNT